MGKKTTALEMIRELNHLSRNFRMNEAHVTAAYARLAEQSRSVFQGITATDALVLAILDDNPGSNGQFVAKQIGMTKSGVSKILTKLQGKKLIRAKKDAADYKSVFYDLTSGGRKVRALHEKMLLIASVEIHRLISDYSDGEIAYIRKFVFGTAA